MHIAAVTSIEELLLPSLTKLHVRPCCACHDTLLVHAGGEDQERDDSLNLTTILTPISCSTT